MGDKIDKNDKVSIVKYFLRKYEDFMRFSGPAESYSAPLNSEQAKLEGELSRIASEVDDWFKVLAKKYESGRQSSPNRIM